MAKITYSALLGPHGQIEDFYDEGALQLQAGKSSATKVIYKGEDQNKFAITGTGLEWEGDILTAGNITGITFTTKEGDPYLSIKGGQHTVEEFNTAYLNGGIEGVQTLLLGAKDTVTGSKISDLIESGGGGDLVHGGAGGDSLDGGIGNDRLFGDAGNDYIFGGANNDRMTGGAGSDSFHFSSGNGNDVITDFDAKGGGGKQDHLSLFDGDDFTIKKSGNNTVLDFGDGETLTLLGVKRADFSVEGDVDWVML
ncbi:MAG: hemolysin expression modulating protein [Rhizobium sp.]|nr:hemolysin expression modulating protein [Rhizobium sp.]